MTEWLERWPDAVFAIWVRKPDGEMYFANTETEGSILRWTIGSGDVDTAGEGFAQVQAIAPVSRTIYYSRIVRTKVHVSLSDMENDPDAADPMEVWANKAILAREEAAEYAAEAKEHADAASMAAINTQTKT